MLLSGRLLEVAQGRGGGGQTQQVPVFPVNLEPKKAMFCSLDGAWRKEREAWLHCYKTCFSLLLFSLGPSFQELAWPTQLRRRRWPSGILPFSIPSSNSSHLDSASNTFLGRNTCYLSCISKAQQNPLSNSSLLMLEFGTQF